MIHYVVPLFNLYTQGSRAMVFIITLKLIIIFFLIYLLVYLFDCLFFNKFFFLIFNLIVIMTLRLFNLDGRIPRFPLGGTLYGTHDACVQCVYSLKRHAAPSNRSAYVYRRYLNKQYTYNKHIPIFIIFVVRVVRHF